MCYLSRNGLSLSQKKTYGFDRRLIKDILRFSSRDFRAVSMIYSTRQMVCRELSFPQAFQPVQSKEAVIMHAFVSFFTDQCYICQAHLI